MSLVTVVTIESLGTLVWCWVSEPWCGWVGVARIILTSGQQKEGRTSGEEGLNKLIIIPDVSKMTWVDPINSISGFRGKTEIPIIVPPT